MKLDGENLAKAKVCCVLVYFFFPFWSMCWGRGGRELFFSFPKVLFSIIGASDKEGIWCHNKH